MLNERLAIARPIAEKIHKAEASLNDSLGLIGELIADIPAARRKLGKHIPLTTGMDACERLAAAAVAAAQGYRQVVEAHQHFASDREDIGLGTVTNWGDINDCPSHGHATLPPTLAVVKAA